MYNLEKRLRYWHLLRRYYCPCNLLPEPTSPKHDYRGRFESNLWLHRWRHHLMTFFYIIWDGLFISEVKLKPYFKMAAILRSRQTFYRYFRYFELLINVLAEILMGIYQFYPRPALASGYCRCLRPSVHPSKFVRAITQHPFKLGLPNLNHRCKRPWLRSLLFWGWLILTFKVKFNFKVKTGRSLSLSAQ